MDGTFEFVDDGEEFIAEPVDVTELLGTDELINHQNEFVSFTGLTVEPAAEGSDAAFLYSYDGSGSDGDDLYFNASYNGQTYTFTVEEVKAGGKGFTYDDTVYEVAIAVTDLGAGKLQAVTTVWNKTDDKKVSETTWTTDSATETTPIALDFTNVYHASGDVAIKVTKEVTGGRPLKEGEFTFKLTTEPNNGGTGTEVATATNKADGTVDFGIFKYTTTGYQAPEGAVNLTDIISGDNAYATMTQVDGKNCLLYTSPSPRD